MSEFLNTKNVCFVIGIIFSSLLYFSYLYVFPSCLLLLIGGILSFEQIKKRKKLFETHINVKLESYEETQQQIKKEFEKIRTELESIRLRQGVSSVYGKSSI